MPVDRGAHAHVPRVRVSRPRGTHQPAGQVFLPCNIRTPQKLNAGRVQRHPRQVWYLTCIHRAFEGGQRLAEFRLAKVVHKRLDRGEQDRLGIANRLS
jgi:hypothetical protein